MKQGALASIVLCLALLPPVFGEEPTPSNGPIDLGLEESVEVQFVLVDFLVLDRRGRTVPGLAADDFLLLVDGKLVEVATLDSDCRSGAVADPRSVGELEADPDPADEPRQIVLVFDYYHMTDTADAMRRVLEMLDTWPEGNDRHMIASLGEVVRLETPFTDDRDELRWALRRMRNDRDLYAGNYGRLTERRFFKRIRVLFDLMERLPGRKTLVLFSGPFVPDGFTHDPEFKELSGLSTTVRTSVYPVDVGGLRTPGEGGAGPLGGPEMLRRLALDTGGRMTADTNDITLAYARAYRDQGCAYTLGFYDRRPRPDKSRRLTIRVNDRPALRVVYPEYYVVRSPETKRESLFRTAGMAPQVFESDQLAMELFVLGPRSATRWRTVMGVEIGLGDDEIVEPGETWEIEGFLRKPNGTIIRSFKRELPMPPTDPATGHNPAVTLFHEFGAPPGDYIASVVLSDPEGDTPRTRTRQASLAQVPRGAPFIVGPILGQRATGDIRDANHPGFLPLLDGATEAGEPLDSLTVLCVRDVGDGDATHTVIRSLTTLDGDAVRQFDDVAVRLDGSSGLHCHELVEPVGTAQLPAGRYEVRARAESGEFVTESETTDLTVERDGPQ